MGAQVDQQLSVLIGVGTPRRLTIGIDNGTTAAMAELPQIKVPRAASWTIGNGARCVTESKRSDDDNGEGCVLRTDHRSVALLMTRGLVRRKLPSTTG